MDASASQSSPSALVRPLVEGWERGDFRPRSELLAPDLVLTGFTASGDDRAEGPEEIAAYLRQFFDQWRDYHITTERIVDLDDRHVLLEGRQRGTGRTSGIEIDETLFVVITLADDRVTEIHWHAYRDGALRAAGLQP